MKHSIQYLFLFFLLATACQPQFEMVPPGSNAGKIKEFSENWYVTADGAGVKNGKDWNNAISFKTFLSMVTDDEASLTNSAFHIRQGNYLVTRKDAANIFSRDVGCVRGGYSTELTYSDLGKCDPALFPTVFTGDVNGNGQADDGDGAFAFVTNGNVRFDNITFKCFYLSNAAIGSKTGMSAVFGVNGAYSSTSVDCRNCIFEDNVSGVDGNSVKEGGPCAYVTEGYFKASNCVFRRNSANSRGGAIRTNGDSQKRASVLFLNSCLFTDNSITGMYGSALQCSSGVMCMNNCTFVHNNGVGATLNGGGAFLVVNSTIIDDKDADHVDNAAFRCESPNKGNSIIVNSLITNSTAGGRGLLLNNGTLTSGGYNLFKNVILNGSSTDPCKPADTKRDMVLTGELQGNTWVWNINQVLPYLNGFAIVDDVYDAVVAFDPKEYCDIAVVGRAFSSWVSPTSMMKDARGSVRGDDRFQPGSYDPNID